MWPYTAMPAGGPPAWMGHEFVGVVEDVGSEVRTLGKGDLVIAPWIISDGTCVPCLEGRQNACECFSMWDLEARRAGRRRRCACRSPTEPWSRCRTASTRR